MSFERLNRWGGYLIWVFLDQFLGAGVGRFFLNVLASHLLGTAPFGIFVTAQNVSSLIGTTPQTGLYLGLARHLVEYPLEQRTSVCATAVRMCHRAMLIIIGIAIACIGTAWVTRLAPPAVLACLIPLMLALYAENQSSLIATELSLRREFQYQAAWTGLRAGGAFALGLLGAWLGGPFGLACGFALGSGIAYIVLRVRRREWMQAPSHPEAARVLRSVWFHISLASMLGAAGDYVPRIVLSVWGSFEDVSHLYGAISVMALFVIIATCCSVFMTYMLASFKELAAVSKSKKRLYVVFAAMVVLGLSVSARIIGPFLVVKFYAPDLAMKALPLFDIVAWALPPVTLAFMVRPLVVKFAPASAIPMVNACVLAGQLIPCLLLVPSLGAPGAAWGLVIGGVVHASAMCVVPVLVARHKGVRPEI